MQNRIGFGAVFLFVSFLKKIVSENHVDFACLFEGFLDEVGYFDPILWKYAFRSFVHQLLTWSHTRPNHKFSCIFSSFTRAFEMLWFFSYRILFAFAFSPSVGSMVGWLVSMEYLPSVYPSTDSINSAVYMSNGFRYTQMNVWASERANERWLICTPARLLLFTTPTHNILDHKRD